jgi:CRP-like cAMP-binding protein
LEVLSLTRENVNDLFQSGYLNQRYHDAVTIIAKNREDQNVEFLRDNAKENNILGNCEILKELSKINQDIIIDKMKFQSFPKGKMIVKQGDVANHMYVITKGRCTVQINGNNIREMKFKDVFGESALFGTGKKDDATSLRSASVIGKIMLNCF